MIRTNSTLSRHSKGFTLIEVIIAMAIFAIVSLLAYTGLQSVIKSKTKTEEALDRLQSLQIAVRTLTTDLQQISTRIGHDSLGSPLLNLTTQDSDYIVNFTRSGWRNPAKQARSTLQRVAYRIEEDALVRVYWPHVDRADDEQIIERTLISNIESLELRFLDENNEYKSDWPALNSLASSGSPTGAASVLPRAIEVTLNMSDWGEIKRLVRVSR